MTAFLNAEVTSHWINDNANYVKSIIQGMSGSPIIQNGKLVGAVPYVFIQDAANVA